MPESSIAQRLAESMTLIIVVFLAALTSLFRITGHNPKRVAVGLMSAILLAYLVNLGLTAFDVGESARVSIVGVCTYLNGYIFDAMNKLGAEFSENPQKTLSSIIGFILKRGK